MTSKTKELEDEEKKQLEIFSDLMRKGKHDMAMDEYGELGFIRGRLFERKELLEEVRKVIKDIFYKKGIKYPLISVDNFLEFEKQLEKLEKEK